MEVIHDLSTPRNLFEKLLRDSEKLNEQVNGDNVFNFISTAYHLQQWIQNSPLISSEVVKRILRRIAHDSNIKHCKKIATAKEHYKLKLEDNSTAKIIIGEEEINETNFRQEILSLYENYFKVK